jgi:1-acyl-sn-glycerol-3-phosphate acyltransferase
MNLGQVKNTHAAAPLPLATASARARVKPWQMVIFSLALTFVGSNFLAVRYLSAVIGLGVWVAAEIAFYHGINPLLGPWARSGSDRAEIIKLLWPMWRLAFAINVGLTIVAIHYANEMQWIAFSSSAAWIIFTSFAVLSAVIHLIVRTPENLERQILRLRHTIFLVIGFGPFAVLCLLSMPAVLLIKAFSFGDKDLIQRRARKMGQIVLRNILKWLEFIGLIQVDFQSPVLTEGKRLIVGNHISMFDIITTLAHVDQCGSFVKSNYAKMPLLKQMIQACRFIPVDPDCYESRKNAMLRAKESLLRGETIAVWPEGSRTKNGTRGVFHNGVFRLALEVGADVIPAVFMSSEPLFSNGGKYRETKKTVTFTVRCEPTITLNHHHTVSPGRVLVARDTVENYFNERLAKSDVPEWMRFHAPTPQPEAT